MNHVSGVAICFLITATWLSGITFAEPPSRRSLGYNDLVRYDDQERPKASIRNHLRLKRDMQDEPVALQTSIVRYAAASGENDLVVDLIGAVHIADRAYYDKLNRLFEPYDVLLYELVAPLDQRIPKKDEGGENPLRMIQKLSQSVLDLSHQLDHIDYTKPNFVHADMSPSEMQQAMHERGDDQMTVMLGAMADLLRQQNLQQRKLEQNPEKHRDLTQIDPLALMLDPYGSAKLKRIMAEQFAELTGMGSGLGQTLDTILIKDRNQAAMRVFQKQLVKGKKRIGIFYGAAHMSDFEERLVRDYGLKRQSVHWLTAWDLSLKPKSPAQGLVGQLLEELLRP